MLGNVISHSTKVTSDINGLLCLNGSLYMLMNKDTIVTIDSTKMKTDSELEIDESKVFKLTRDNDKETGRKLSGSPLFSDG